MSLVDCPECDRQMSDRAVQCPSCGFHVGAVRPWWHWVVLALLLTLLAVMAYSIVSAMRNDDDSLDCVTENLDRAVAGLPTRDC